MVKIQELSKKFPVQVITLKREIIDVMKWKKGDDISQNVVVLSNGQKVVVLSKEE